MGDKDKGSNEPTQKSSGSSQSGQQPAKKVTSEPKRSTRSNKSAKMYELGESRASKQMASDGGDLRKPNPTVPKPDAKE